MHRDEGCPVGVDDNMTSCIEGCCDVRYPHNLRHTTASLLADAGVRLDDIAEVIMRHGSALTSSMT